MVYSQARTFYDLVPHAPHPSTDPSKPHSKAHVDGVVGSIQPQFAAKSIEQQISSSPKTTSSPIVSTEVNAGQSSQSPRNKKKGKGKSKKHRNQ